jgi:cytochrome P450
MWNNNRIMKNYLLPHLSRTISEYGSVEGYKTITSLAVKAYLKDVKQSSSSVDVEFVNIAIAQLKMFIFAGHDTTASAISFAYHLLWTNQEKLARLRAEHDAVLGPDPAQTVALIKASPQLLNKLPYTAAVIKETLRLFPPVGTVRQGRQDFFLIHPDTGVRYPTEGFMLFGCSIAEQRDAAFWPRPDDFLPERWLVATGEGNGGGGNTSSDAMRVRKNAFRPFELGPRNCIGQELAQLELRAILALTVRELDVQSAYAENGPRVFNDLAYQTLAPGEVTAHPAKGMPVTVKIRS